MALCLVGGCCKNRGGHAVVFWEYLIFLPRILFNGLRSAAKGNRSRICFYEKA